MRICQAFLIVVDISGYTRFITERSLTLEHAEQVISDLINTVLDKTRSPLVLNKLEGDAALMYAEIDGSVPQAEREILGQVRSFFPAFRQRVAELSQQRQNCSCDACRNITALTLKAFVHTGEILLKKIRQFDEVAGEPVILLHRLMKNSVVGSEYVLLSDAAMRGAGLDPLDLRSHVEEVEGMGLQQLWLALSDELPSASLAPESADKTRGEVIQTKIFRNLPEPVDPGPSSSLMARLSKWLRG